MRSFLTIIITALVVAVPMHFITLHGTPQIIMAVAVKRITETGLGFNRFSVPRPITPQNQAVVRSSPDLSYSVCVVDLSAGDVRVSVPQVRGYGSLSVFDERTNNIHVADLGGVGGDVELLLTSKTAAQAQSNGGKVVKVKGKRAVVLVRLIAANENDFRAATRIARQSTCAPVGARQ